MIEAGIYRDFTHTNCGGEIEQILLLQKPQILVRCKKCKEEWEQDEY